MKEKKQLDFFQNSLCLKKLAIKTPKRLILASKWSFKRSLLLKIALIAFIFSSKLFVQGQAYETKKEGYLASVYVPPSSYNTQQSGTTSPVYVEDYRGTVYDGGSHPYSEYGGMTSFNREYNTTTDYDYNRAAVTTATSSATLTEAQLLGMLNSKGKEIYLNLDPEGKSLAIQLASLDSYHDKNLAVREAYRRMIQRRGLYHR